MASSSASACRRGEVTVEKFAVEKFVVEKLLEPVAASGVQDQPSARSQAVQVERLVATKLRRCRHRHRPPEQQVRAGRRPLPAEIAGIALEIVKKKFAEEMCRTMEIGVTVGVQRRSNAKQGANRIPT